MDRKPTGEDEVPHSTDGAPQTGHVFEIESDHSGRLLSLDRKSIGKFPTLGEAEAEAERLARSFEPGASLTFEVGYMSTLSEVEIRTAKLE